MIEFRCSNCNKKINTPDSYAGKRGKCPQCGHIVCVPTPQKESEHEKQAIIKFRCPHCNQKIGISENYAGKQVRCAKCRQPMQVPKL
jgi:DNA-directed RNA polymerase subunit RPC12/RpoP